MTLGMFSPPVVVCDHCEGRTRMLQLCRCVQWGNRFLVDADDGQLADGQAYQGCEQCGGSGYVAYDCHPCRRTGQRRAQLVLTVANLDTGAVRSANVVPGGMEPRRNVGGRWELALTPIIAALAAEVGAVECRDGYGLGNIGDYSILLPTDWRPGLPLAERQRLEGEAIARHTWHPWRLYHGRLTPTPARDLAAELGRLCHLADLLCLDLVVEVRRARHGGLAWDIRYELPDGGVPTETRRWSDDLRKAVAAATVQDAMHGLADRARTAPAYYLRPNRPQRLGPPTVDLDQLEQRVHADLDGIAGSAPGAQAIWRDGRWRHTRLCHADTIEVMTEQSTGQVVRRSVTTLVRAWEPPAPGWQGEPIPYDPCPDCAPEHRLRPCLCTLGNQSPDPDCPGCSGAGVAPTRMRCHTCRDSHRNYRGAVVTLTDLGDATVHLNWLVPEEPTEVPQVGNQPGGKPIFQLPVCYQLRHWAEIIEARAADLTFLDGDHDIGQDLREGTVTVNQLGIDPVARYITEACGGHPAARMLVSAVTPAGMPLTGLIRLVLGLHQTLVLTLEDHRFNEGDPALIHGEGWNVEMTPPERAIRPDLMPLQRSPEAAAAYFLEYLENATDNSVPEDPQQGIPVPQTPEPAPLVEDPVPLIRRLAQHHAGQPVSIRYHHTGCHLYVHEAGLPGQPHSGSVRHLVSARTAAIALNALGLGRP
ncbi:hypothetical protein GCM10027290_07760 [Micromonospora sonneratiae]|uniref:Uncharacterized protein n=1 Tax=Micromonospora sonneratiae TaxID=1184706 RepID=A0ABW3YCT4_9ACTN